MVYCPKCGTKNEEDATFCVKCGAALYPEKREEKREDSCFGPREKRVEDECFGIPYGGAIVGILVGAFIIILGLAIAFGQDITRWIGPFILVAVGLLIIIGAIIGLSRRPRV